MGMIQIDIPMPKCCRVCIFASADYSNGIISLSCTTPTGRSMYAPDLIYRKDRPEWCPLKEQEVRELTMDEWREWKNNPKRNPICELWEHNTSPMWVLNPDTIHEPALLMGKLKLFTGKPTFEQCKEIKWE